MDVELLRVGRVIKTYLITILLHVSLLETNPTLFMNRN